MGKWLNGSAKTGDKIMKNITDFSFDFAENNQGIFRFNWCFNNQTGYVGIKFDSNTSKISNSSLIDTNATSTHKFSRPLGLYNDSSLFNVFVHMMKTQDLDVVGVYSE